MSSQHEALPATLSFPAILLLAGTAMVLSAAPLCAAERFRRADSNADGILELTDAVHTLGFLFRGVPDRLLCQDSADSNDDGKVDISDAVHTLGYLFLGTPGPPPPFGGAVSDCGVDPTPDQLGCERYASCPPLPPAAPLLVPPRSPTRDPAVELRGTAEPGLEVRITGGVSPAPVLTTAGPDGAFTAEVELTPRRLNRLFAVVHDARGQESAPAAVEVIQDPEPPFVYADEPVDGATLLTDRITVTGRVSDMLSGFEGLAVTVSGAPAAIAIGIGTNGTFERQGVPLLLGENTITVVATDAVGNTATRELRVTREEIPPEADRIELVTGNAQAKRPIHTTLPEPIVVRALRADGTPIEGKLVLFRVVRSDGRLASRVGTAPDDRVMTLAVLTDPDGLAAAHWTLGGDAGCGNNRVRATARGLAGEVLFCASAAPGPAAQINIGSGQNQRGEAGAPAPEALRAWVSDGCNGIPGVPVTFAVTRGTGSVDGARMVTVPTGPTGHAQVRFAFGPETGNQGVEADFAGNLGSPASFLAYALRRDESRPTTFTGLVLDNAARPIQGALLRLQVPGLDAVETRTDLQGRFALAAPAAGPASLGVEGASATHVGGEGGEDVPLGSFPSLTYEMTLVPNAESSLASPVLLPELDPENAAVYDGTAETVLRVKGIEGFEMRVAAGTTVTLSDRTRIGPGQPGSVRLSLDQVHQDDIPMAMPDGAAPPVAWTLQPRGAKFDPPLQVSYPNVSALPPGAIANFLTFNHDTGRFEVFSSGQVSSDGSTIDSDPGSGISVAGWGGLCPPYPTPEEVEKCKVDCSERGALTGGEVTGATLVCLGQPLQLSFSGVVDEGGVETVECEEGSSSRIVPPGQVTYSFEVDLPDGQTLSGDGDGSDFSFTPSEPGTFVYEFTARSDRKCAPEPRVDFAVAHAARTSPARSPNQRFGFTTAADGAYKSLGVGAALADVFRLQVEPVTVENRIHCVSQSPQLTVTPDRNTAGQDFTLSASQVGDFAVSVKLESATGPTCDVLHACVYPKVIKTVAVMKVLDINQSLFVSPSLIDLPGYLNDVVYDQAQLEWQVTTLPDLTLFFDLNFNDQLDPDLNEQSVLYGAASSIGGFDKIVMIVQDIGGTALGFVPSLGSSFIIVEAGIITPEDLYQTISHELGHSLGLDHVVLPDNLMFPRALHDLLPQTDLVKPQWDLLNPR